MPLFAPNKIVLWDEAATVSSPDTRSAVEPEMHDMAKASTLFDVRAASSSKHHHTRAFHPPVEESIPTTRRPRSPNAKQVEARQRVAAWAREAGQPDVAPAKATLQGQEDDASSIASSSRHDAQSRRSRATSSVSSFRSGEAPSSDDVAAAARAGAQESSLYGPLADRSGKSELHGISASQLHHLSGNFAAHEDDVAREQENTRGSAATLGMGSSQHSAANSRSISASSAGLDDPFASHSEDESSSASSSGPAASQIDKAALASISGMTGQQQLDDQAWRSARHRRNDATGTTEMGSAAGLARHLDDLSLGQAASAAPRMEVEMERSVTTSVAASDLGAHPKRYPASSDAARTPTRAPEIAAAAAADTASQSLPQRKGREVAELEFGQAVKGVVARSFALEQQAGRTVVLVALLETQAHVFQLQTRHEEAGDAALEAENGALDIRQVAKLDVAARSSRECGDGGGFKLNGPG